MSTATMGSPIRKVYGEQVSLTTTAGHLLFMPNYHEVLLDCNSDWRMGIAPRLARVKLYTGSAYTNYTAEATDRSASTHVPLDGMTTSKWLYLGVTEPTRGFYFNVSANVNANAATLDWEYMYDIAKPGAYYKLTGTVSAALTVGETVTGGTSAATGAWVYDDGSTYGVVKTISGQFALGETVSGAAQNISAITDISVVATGTGYFTDVASDSDGTDSGGVTLAQDGLYSFTLPSVVRGCLTGVDPVESLYWYRFKPSTTLSATVDLLDIIPACDTVNYAYMKEGVVYLIPLNVAQNGAFEFDHTGADTLNITWIMH